MSEDETNERATTDILGEVAERDLMRELNNLARRFQGVDVQFRGGPWNSLWVASNYCNAYHISYRISRSGQTPDTAIARLLDAIAEVDQVTARDAVLGRGRRVDGVDRRQVTERDLMRELNNLARRFQGVGVQFRGGLRGSLWVASNYCSKNERDAYRISRSGPTPDAAIARLLDAITEVDRS